MTGQPVHHSIGEVITSTLAGYAIAIATQMAVYPFYGIAVPISGNMEIAAIFTVISMIRGYIFRRLWNRLS